MSENTHTHKHTHTHTRPPADQHGRCVNEGAEAWGLHYKALKDAHLEVHYNAAWSSLDVVDKEHVFRPQQT